MMIPGVGVFGNAIAQPQQAVNMPVVSTGAGAQAVGGALRGIADDQAQMARQQAEKERREAERLREKADQAKATSELQTAEDDLTTISDTVAEGVRTGTVDKTKAVAEFGKVASARTLQAAKNLPDEHREIGQVHLAGQVSKFSRLIGKAVTQRDQQDVASGMEQRVEFAGRLFLTEPKKADQIANEVLDQLGPYSGFNPLQIQQKRQAYKEASRFNLASALVNGARTDNKALTAAANRINSDEFSDLDPGRKTQLLTSVSGYQVSNTQRAEAEARRRQAEADRVLRQAESQFNAAQSIIGTGKLLSPEYVDQVSKAVAGTPYQAAFKEALSQGPENAAFGAQPLATQAQVLSEGRARLNQAGTNPSTEKRFVELERIHEQAQKDYAEDPLLAAQERGVLQRVEPIAFGDVPSLVAGLRQRVPQAELVSQQVGQPVSPLLKAEAEQVGRLLATLPFEQRSAALSALGKTVGPLQAAALGRQMAPKDKALGIALGMAGVKTTAGRYASELVLRGAQALKDKSVDPESQAVTGVRSQVAAEIGNAYPNNELRGAMIDAAVFAYYGLRAEGTGNIAQAVNFATGGLAERNGRKLPMPEGMELDQFETKLRAITPVDLAQQLPDGAVYAGSTKLDAAQFVKALPDAVLLHAGKSKYFVQAGGTLVTNAKRQPIIITVR